MALKGLQIIELAGLVPSPFCGMIFADFGATVIRIDKIKTFGDPHPLSHGKKSVLLNLKNSSGIEIFKKLCKTSDVLIEPFKPGTMESLGIGPDVILNDNPKIIYARLSGYGQNGSYSKKPGHDINFVALSGLLSLFGKPGDKPRAPSNIPGDIGGGALMCTIGILIALLERHSSNLGQVIDANIVEGAYYLSSYHRRRNKSLITGGESMYYSDRHFYDYYRTKDGKYMSVGPLELKYYNNLVKALGIDENLAHKDGDPNKLGELLSKKFLEKTQNDWCEVFSKIDACVVPVLSFEEVPFSQHAKERKSFAENSFEQKMIPRPAPKLSRTPGETRALALKPKLGEHTEEIMTTLGYTIKDIQNLESLGVIERNKGCNL